MRLQSFFQAGFECATGWNAQRQWIDQIEATGHDRHALADYRRCHELGIRTVREGVRWPLVDLGKGGYDFSSFAPMLEAANETGTELILDLFHYGFPEGLDPFGVEFAPRFADYCFAVGRYISRYARVPVHFTPINEPSYFAWAAGDAGKFAPYCFGRSFELKVQLARAAIWGIEALWTALPGCRIVNVDPLCRICGPVDDYGREHEIRDFNECAVFQSWDMLAGLLMPELGGSIRHLDVVGINYYWTNQWEIDWAGHPLGVADPRVWPLRDLVRWVWHRYGAPMILTETSHYEDERASWLTSVAEEVAAIHAEGLPLYGACIYPVLGMPEWHERDKWARMGLWDVDASHPDLPRTPHEPLVEVLQNASANIVAPVSPRRHPSRSGPTIL